MKKIVRLTEAELISLIKNTINEQFDEKGGGSNNLEKAIISIFEKDLKPYHGWMSRKDYKDDLKDGGGEIFLQLEKNFDDFDNSIWYSLCVNTNLIKQISESMCPLATIPDTIYGKLMGLFGDIWKDIFINWFEKNTGLKVKMVSSQFYEDVLDFNQVLVNDPTG